MTFRNFVQQKGGAFFKHLEPMATGHSVVLATSHVFPIVVRAQHLSAIDPGDQTTAETVAAASLNFLMDVETSAR